MRSPKIPAFLDNDLRESWRNTGAFSFRIGLHPISLSARLGHAVLVRIGGAVAGRSSGERKLWFSWSATSLFVDCKARDPKIL